MGTKAKKKKAQNGSSDLNMYLLLIPLIVAIAIVPLLVRMTPTPVSLIEQTLWNHVNSTNDFFSKVKSDWIFIAAIIAGIFFVFRFIMGQMAFKKINVFIPLTIFTILTIISSMAQTYKPIFIKNYTGVVESPTLYTDGNLSLLGFWDRYEGLYVWLSYALLFVVTIHFLNKTKEIEIITNSLLISACIIGTIGVFQFVGIDYFRSSIGKLFMVPSAYKEYREALNFNFGKGVIYGTLYNPNYVGSYMALLLPIPIVLYLYESKKRLSYIYLAVTLLVFANLIGSNSTTGLFGIAIATIIFAVVARKELIRQKGKTLAIVAGFVLVFVIMNLNSNFLIVNSLLKTSFNLQKETAVEVDPNIHVVSGDQELIKNIEKIDGGYKIIGEKVTSQVIYENNQLIFKDGDGIPLEVSNDSQKYYFNDARYAHYQYAMLNENVGAVLKIGAKELTLYFDISGIKLVGSGGMFFEITDVPTLGFKGHEFFGTSRGYIWSRSLPLIKNTLFIGTGPDTYAAVFPQNDIIGKLNYEGNGAILVDKPHNMYIQLAINTGVVSMIAFIIMVGLYMISGYKYIIRKPLSSYESYLGLGIMTSVFAYMVAAIANDSLVSVSCVFWILLGIGVSINYKIKQQLK